MLVEFERAVDREITELNEGEDDGIGQPRVIQPLPIAINPIYVSAVLESQRQPGTCAVRLSDGRGFMVRGFYTEVVDKLRANGASEFRA